MTVTAPTAPPEPLLRRLVGGILRERREAQGRTLRDVARDARVSVAYLSEIERGRKEASSEVLVAVCRALGMGMVDLLGEAYGLLAPQAVVVDLTARAGHDGRPDTVLSLTSVGRTREAGAAPRSAGVGGPTTSGPGAARTAVLRVA
ncbi:helix-turn-helix domain-containing protein [Actinotalea solisilvae]|uniref:helix-turn-helix domain-containing protein n=1 Tax=Actinotalea solisilvae TaxID=2072922 RepID=UPI0018F206D1|nr:helix-turn-helix domain-containing protein [Actinotalea solisilvae]